MIRIESESNLNVKYPFEIDNFSKRYVTTNGYFVFTSPSLHVLEKNRFYLLSNAIVKPFDKKYKYKPSYLSIDEYEVRNLDYLLMFINNVSCAEEFDLQRVIIPSIESIVTMCLEKEKTLEISEMERISW